jgi:hypothetical protein
MNPKYPSIQEMIQKLQEAGRTPIVPAPNRWFADPVKHPFQQKMIERVLAQTGQGREGFPSGSYINPQTGEPMDFDIMHDLGVAIDPNTGRPMMSGIKSDLTHIDPKYGSITKSNLVRKGLFKHEGGDELLKNLAFLATIEKSGKGHHYGLSTHYASPAELVNTMTGQNPTLRPHSRGDIFGVGDEVGRISIQGKHHPVYEKLLVAPAGSDVQGKKLHKAKGGVAHMADGGQYQSVMEDYNQPSRLPTAEEEAIEPVYPEEYLIGSGLGKSAINAARGLGNKVLSSAEMALRPAVKNDVVISKGIGLKDFPIRMPNSNKDITHAYRNMSQAEYDAAKKSGYFEANPYAKYEAGTKWWSGGDELGKFGREWKGGKDAITVRVPRDKVPENKAVRFKDVKQMKHGGITHAHHLQIEERPL